MRKIKILSKLCLVLFGVVLVCGCNSEEAMKAMLKKTIPPADDKFAQEYVEIIKSHDYEKSLSLLSPEIRNTVQKSDMEKIASFLDSGEIVSVEVIGCNVFKDRDKKTVTMGYQYQIGESWVAASVVVANVKGQQQILGIHVNPIPKSLKEINAFTFTGKGVMHYAFLAVMAIIFMLTLYALVLCIKSRIRKKWLWIILVFAGIGQIFLDWTTGQIFFNPLSLQFQLFGVSVLKSGLYTPWMMKTFIPVGAIVFLVKRKKLVDNYSNPHNPQNVW